jgi:two-component system, sensor histidine kinase PdtaS
MSNRAAGENDSGSLVRLRRHGNILLDFSRIAAETRDLRRLLELACQHMARATNVHHSKILRYQSESADLRMVAGQGWEPGTVDHALLAFDMASPAGRGYQTRTAINIGDLPKSTEFRYDQVLQKHGIISVLNAPIAVDGVVWGIAEVDSTEEDAFDEEDERFLQTFGFIIAQAVRNRRERRQRERDTEELGRRLAATDLLVGEQNHRVRNYFQLILSLLATRSSRAKDERVRQEYREVMERITAVALAHDLLIVDHGQSTVNAATYLDALCTGLERTMGGEVRIARDLEAMPLRPDRAVPLGLAANELLTNAFKHALKDQPGGTVSLSLTTDVGTGDIMLVVRDNGPGMKEERPGSQGLRLIRSLAGQLSGRIEIDSGGGGTTVTLIFPHIG